MYGERIKGLREDNDLTQKELADKLGVGIRTYQKYESEEIEPKASTLQTLADIYGCTIDYIMGRTAHPREGISEFSISGNKIEIGYDKSIYPNGITKEKLLELLNEEIQKKSSEAAKIILDKITKPNKP